MYGLNYYCFVLILLMRFMIETRKIYIGNKNDGNNSPDRIRGVPLIILNTFLNFGWVNPNSYDSIITILEIIKVDFLFK